MAVLSKTEISALSTQERLALIDDLWESLEENQAVAAASSAQVPEWQRRILDERLLDLEICPGDDLSLAEARGQSLLSCATRRSMM
jgi:putative addiction module component (TIGR02574 family)